jgi:hypothetical protein
MLRDTPYATEVVTASITLGDGSEARLERIHVKTEDHEEIRFSWWKNGNIVMRPLDLCEDDLINLFHQAVVQHVFTPSFIGNLRDVITDI